MPPAPPGLGPARWHSLVLALGTTLFRSIGYYETHVRALIWRLSFAKCFLSIFFPEKCVPNRFWHTRGNSPSAVSETTTAKTSEWERASIKTGVQGRSPGPLSPHFSGEMGTPPGRRAPGALRPEVSEQLWPPVGYAPPAAQAPGPAERAAGRCSKQTTPPGPAAPRPKLHSL